MEKIRQHISFIRYSSAMKNIQVPLLDDLKAQKRILPIFLVKFAIFLSLFFISDRMLGDSLKAGLDRYFGLDRPANVLCIGHSHTVLGIDKTGLEDQLNLPVAKYARQGANISNRLAMIRHYLAVHPHSVKTIIYDMDAHTFTGEGLSANSHRLFYPFMDTPVIREYVKANCSSYGEYQLRNYLKLPRFDEVTLALSLRGWLKKWSNLKYGQVNVQRLRNELNQGDYRKIAFDSENIELFEETLRLIRAHGIHLVLVYIPTIDLLNNAEPEKYQEAIRRFEKYAAQSDGITFLNYNPEFSHRHELFYDPIHLNVIGQKLITERLANDLKKLTVN